MSDFTSSFWSLYVAAISVLGILACLLLLWVTARKKSAVVGGFVCVECDFWTLLFVAVPGAWSVQRQQVLDFANRVRS